MGKPKKRVSTPSIRQKEVPRRDLLPGAETSDVRICWRFTHVDHDGPWGFDKVTATELRWIMECLTKFESMTIDELFRSGGYPGKDYEVDTLPTARQVLVRLEGLGIPDMTKIWALRLQGEPRLYGFLVGHAFHIVFWDPKHEIWPSKLKHT
jgi:hypothetical protein